MYASIVIPAHNEGKRLLRTLVVYCESLQQRLGQDFEVLVVANACTDDTVKVASDFAARHCPQVRIVDINEPVGKGGAVLEGFRQARGDRILFVDADGATASESLLDLLGGLKLDDLVIGSRWLDNSVIRRPQPLGRRVFSRLFNASVRYLFGLPYQDTQCGAKALRRAAALQLAAVVQETGWAFDVDLLLWSRFLGFSVREMAVVWSDQEGSKLRVGSTLREVSAALWKLRQRNMGSVWERRIDVPEEVRL